MATLSSISQPNNLKQLLYVSGVDTSQPVAGRALNTPNTLFFQYLDNLTGTFQLDYSDLSGTSVAQPWIIQQVGKEVSMTLQPFTMSANASGASIHLQSVGAVVPVGYRPARLSSTGAFFTQTFGGTTNIYAVNINVNTDGTFIIYPINGTWLTTAPVMTSADINLTWSLI